MLKTIIKNNYKDTALTMASSIRNLASIQYLVDNNAEINARNEEGWTALRIAKHRKNTAEEVGEAEKIVNYLMSKEAVE